MMVGDVDEQCVIEEPAEVVSHWLVAVVAGEMLLPCKAHEKQPWTFWENFFSKENGFTSLKLYL